MSDTTKSAGNAPGASGDGGLQGKDVRQEKIVKLRPTLFIGVGGTGMEVMLRVRRRILNQTWGSSNPVRVESVNDFPIAQFIHFDLDQGAILDSGKTQADDPLAELVKLSDDDKIVENFELDRYSRSDDDLDKYKHIAPWSPLQPAKIRALNINPSKGAGQIRGISRLYFFDKYTKVRDRIRQKLNMLQQGLSKQTQLDRLGLDLQPGEFRIIVVGSIAGGTGGGAFLDMGWLSSWLANTGNKVSTEMMMFLPTGYQKANKLRTEANAYASLMELETCMRGFSNYVTTWDPFETPQLRMHPYDEVYLIDSGNLAQLHTGNQNDVYDMVADALFEDFTSADFANRKRSVAVNQQQHKILPYNPPVQESRYSGMRLSYFKGYSAFGHAMLDTQQSIRQDIQTYDWTSAMLKAFFGVATVGGQVNRASDKQRDDFMVSNLRVAAFPFVDFPDFSAKEIDLKLSGGEFIDWQLTEELITDRGVGLVQGLQTKVAERLDFIAQNFDKDEWPTQVRNALKELERDAVRDQDSTADTSEDRINRRRREVFGEITDKIRDQLYAYLDNKEFGGLEYVFSLVEQIKDRLDNPARSLVGELDVNSRRYSELRDAVRTHEYERLLNNLVQTKGGFSLLGSKEKQAREILELLKVEIGNYLKFHLRAKAAGEASLLLSDLSKWLGEKLDVDEQGNARWSGFLGELQAGRNTVLGMIAEIDRRIRLLREDTRKEHATYIKIDAELPEAPLPDAKRLREWADEAFADFGGSRKLFAALADRKRRDELIAKVRARADVQRAAVMQGTATVAKDPLVEALKRMSSAERSRRFADLLQRAMPWVDANLQRDFQVASEQYKLYLGVGRAKDWDVFMPEIIAQVPVQAGITATQLAFVDTGVPGRAVCYCELSGIPLTVLRGLEAWRTSYRIETEKIPLHTHADTTQFTHPLVPSTQELKMIAEDFRTYLLGVMLRVLTREPGQRVKPPGQYQFAVAKGDVRRMGNERAFRLNGLPANYRNQITDAVLNRVDALTPLQLIYLAVLADWYKSQVYKPRLVAGETGAETDRMGFAAAISLELAQWLRDKAKRMGLDDVERRRHEALADDQIEAWTELIEYSDADAYAWEVADSETPRLKARVKADFLDAQSWQPLGQAAQPGQSAGAQQAVQPMAASPTQAYVTSTAAQPVGGFAAGGVAMPPPLPQAVQVWVAINNVQQGPFGLPQLQSLVAQGAMTPQTLVWRQGMAGWSEAQTVPELAMLFAPPPLMPPPFP